MGGASETIDAVSYAKPRESSDLLEVCPRTKVYLASRLVRHLVLPELPMVLPSKAGTLVLGLKAGTLPPATVTAEI
jgi:hypothetical protein